jgi:hypothetical protein
MFSNFCFAGRQVVVSIVVRAQVVAALLMTMFTKSFPPTIFHNSVLFNNIPSGMWVFFGKAR